MSEGKDNTGKKRKIGDVDWGKTRIMKACMEIMQELGRVGKTLAGGCWMGEEGESVC